MADPFVAEIRIFPFTFPPKGWAFCNGQLLPISQNTALFALLGTFYGGDGKSTFALPGLQGSVPIHQGQGSGLSEYFIGQEGGSETVTLLESEMPAHNHFMRVNTQDPADVGLVNQNAVFAKSTGGLAYQTSSNTQLAFQALTPNGSGAPHNNMMPYLTLNFNIALQGVFPQRP
jgi:microcystin-dependent protein